MKKMLSLGLALAMSCTMMLTGCSNKEEAASTTAAAAKNTEAAASTGETDWPNNTVNVTLPYSAGGDTDTYCRALFQRVGDKLGQTFVVTNLTGGSGVVAAMDIMANEGFLLTNYQGDFLLENFIPDEDFVYFEDEKDLLHKIDYYLIHDEKRISIAQNGRNKIKEYFSYRICFEKIFHIVFS